MSAQNDAAFLRMFLIVLGALVVFTVVIMFAANLITGAVDESRGEDPRYAEARAERIKPVGKVNIAGAPKPAAPAPAAAAPAPAPAPEPAPAATEAPATSAAPDPAQESASEPAVAAAPAQASSAIDGKAIYDTACFACHLTGAAGAPKLADKAAWAPRIATGLDALYASSLNGKGAMPPKGGRMDLSDEAVKSAVDYMVEQSK